jgi:hypothetical protein
MMKAAKHEKLTAHGQGTADLGDIKGPQLGLKIVEIIKM